MLDNRKIEEHRCAIRKKKSDKLWNKKINFVDMDQEREIN